MDVEVLPPAGNEDPLTYMLRVMNDPSADEGRRDRMATAAAPYVHRKLGEGGKKDAAKDAADRAAGGRFAPGAPPSRTGYRH